MSVFNEGVIRDAITKYQQAHPLPFNSIVDCTRIGSFESVDLIKSVVDKYIKQAEKDSDIYVICEMARLYLDGVRPYYTDKEHYEEAYQSGFNAGILEAIRRVRGDEE